MGHRANYVIVRNGEARAFYDQWGALGCIHTFAGGPVDALAVAEQAEATDELQDWAFAEGGFLVDFDRQKAIVFGLIGEPIDPADLEELEGVEGLEGFDFAELGESAALEQALGSNPEDFLRNIAPRWSGWHLSWNDRGVDSFAAHLQARGIESIKVQPASAPETAKSVEIQA